MRTPVMRMTVAAVVVTATATVLMMMTQYWLLFEPFQHFIVAAPNLRHFNFQFLLRIKIKSKSMGFSWILSLQ
jgi:hypothetical protein